jgi:hypothetical protein
MTTGCECECMAAAGRTDFGSGLDIGKVLLDRCFSTGLTLRGEGGFRARVPILSDLARGDEGDCIYG